MASEAAMASPPPGEPFEHARSKGLLATAGDDDAPGTPEELSHPPTMQRGEAESLRTAAPTAPLSEEGPETPRADHEALPESSGPFAVGGRECAVGPMSWFAHAADMVQVRGAQRFPPVSVRVFRLVRW